MKIYFALKLLLRSPMALLLPLMVTPAATALPGEISSPSRAITVEVVDLETHNSQSDLLSQQQQDFDQDIDQDFDIGNDRDFDLDQDYDVETNQDRDDDRDFDQPVSQWLWWRN